MIHRKQNRIEITPEMISKCIEIIQKAQYDGNKFECETGPNSPCSIVAALFPTILDMALVHLKRKSSTSLVEYVQDLGLKKPDTQLIPIPIFIVERDEGDIPLFFGVRK